ncbi:mercury resistance system transport protein MerF [Pseudalkalibacillus sp. SCS-8]|uniref:mercury resistance system transport protein MerF n=1 Tax=Pseudalkalibacillus nanhaiensis TaxID=3115291 RepID=UPI0032DAD494
MERKKSKRLLTGGIIGTITILICCFTPVLVILFGAVGLSFLIGYLDLIVFPALGIFIGLTIFAYSKYKKGER